MKRVHTGVVIDLEADLLPHPNGSDWLRLVIQPNRAMELYRDLKEYFNG